MKERILVIDDDKGILEVFRAVLLRAGYQIDTVESGERGIEAAKARLYDLIFLDLNMPGLNGIETLRGLREIEKKIPIYVTTGYQDMFFEELKELNREGINFEILVKPVSPGRLISVTKSILKDPDL